MRLRQTQQAIAKKTPRPWRPAREPILLERLAPRANLMSEMSRLESLQSLVEQSPADTRIRFMLAMEWLNAARPADALAAFDALIALDADFVAAYFQAGRATEAQGDVAAARAYYERGIAAATRTGDRHALSEISDALALLA
jgi:tetratricopeptide (TPR) repeat protein